MENILTENIPKKRGRKKKQIEEPPIDKSIEWKRLNLKPFDNGKRVNFEWKKLNANLYN